MADRSMEIIFAGLDGRKVDRILNDNDVRLIIKGLDVKSLKTALAILDRAQTKVPVDTGFLKSTGYITQREDGYEVGYSADYAWYVHEMEGANFQVGQAKFLEEAYYEILYGSDEDWWTI